METKRLSANGVFQARRNITRSDFFSQCSNQIYSTESTIKRFWEAKEKINADIYEQCCNIANINPAESEDRSPFYCVISETDLLKQFNFAQETLVKSTIYNEIVIHSLQAKLEFNRVIILGEWKGQLRDDYHEMPKELSLLLNSFMLVGRIKVVNIEDKKLFEVSSDGKFCLKYVLNLQDFQIQTKPHDVTLTINNEFHKIVFENFTKYQNRVTEPIRESEIFSSQILQEVIERTVSHRFFKIREFSADNSSLRLKIDESYAENKSRVETELSRVSG